MEKILMMSAESTGDPYITLLKISLLKEGIKINFPKRFYNYFPFIRNCFLSNCRNLHIHWIQYFSGSKGRNYYITIKKMFFFIIDVLITKYILRAKFVWTVHNLYTHDSSYLQIDKLGRKFFSRIVDGIICHCNQAKREIQKIYEVSPKKIHIIPYGNVQEFYKNEISKDDAREFLNLKKETFIFCHYGRIKPYKGVFDLINSFKALNQNENIKLMVIGAPRTDELKAHILDISKNTENIILKLDFVPNDDVQYYINASDIIVVSYKKILTSGVVIMAITFGKPIIAPKLGCITETLDENGAILYDSHEKDGLKNALKKTLELKDKLLKMGHYNFNLAKKLKWENIGKQTIRVYSKYLK